MKKMFIMRGTSGAGKSTYVAKNLRGVICSADHYFSCGGQYVFDGSRLYHAHKQCFDNAHAACEAGKEDVIIDNTNTTLKEMKRYVDLAAEYDYEVEVIRMSAPVDVASKRNTHGVPEKSVQAMADRFQDYPGEIIVNGESLS